MMTTRAPLARAAFLLGDQDTMKNDHHLTQGYPPILARSIASHPGMGHFAATGPFGTKCAGCEHFGYWRQIQNAVGDVVGTKFRKNACAKYFQLTRQHGPAVPAGTESCRYFTPRNP
jgi:hypothetical protein